LSDIGFGDINEVYYKITSNNILDVEMKLKYIRCLLEINETTINQTSIVYYSLENPKLFLGFYLFNLEVENRLTRLFNEVLKLFFFNGGCREIKIIGEDSLNEKMKSKNILFKELII
jgi:hypothetical protein